MHLKVYRVILSVNVRMIERFTIMKSQKEQQKIENGCYIAGLCLLAVVLLYFFIYKTTGFRLEEYVPPCIFHKITGYYCPGCGGTRAVYALFRGDLLGCFRYQPFIFYVAVFGGWFLISQTIERVSKGRIAVRMRYRECYLWISLVILLINFLVKNMALLIFHIDLLTM